MEDPTWDFDCSAGLTFWIDRFAYIADQSFAAEVLTPAVSDNKGISSLTFTENVDTGAPVTADLMLTYRATDFAMNTNSCLIEVRVKSRSTRHRVVLA